MGRKAAWTIKENFPVWSGALVTAGDVVFYGTMEGWFKAVDATTGELLWQFKTGSGIIGQPVTYRGPDGKQYVAVLSGIGGWPGAVVVGRNVLEWRLDPRSDARLPEAAYDARVLVLCQEGYTSSLAADALLSLGIRRATDVAGGFQAWRDAGLPTAAQPASRSERP